MKTFLRLIRAPQWYKNLVAFVPLIFSGDLMDLNLVVLSVLAFISLCLISSVSYIINDIIDAPKDRNHPTKKSRPIASGKVSATRALLIAAILLIFFIGLNSFIANLYFTLACLALFVSNMLYSLFLKNYAVIDIFTISFNFAVRALAGNLIIMLPVSPWLLLIIFMLALFLAVGKRKTEMKQLGDKAADHRKTNAFYNQEMLGSMTIITLTLLLVFYSIYTIFVKKQELMITIPIALFLVFRYLYFISIDSPIASKNELVFRDKQMLLGMIVWAAVSFAILYLM